MEVEKTDQAPQGGWGTCITLKGLICFSKNLSRIGNPPGFSSCCMGQE